ncbi:MAG TPA: 6-phosphofructokinase [Roseiflexaceae bacterium]|nr:6-phosphofructokinase [Roseiflexaceae bacterium]
MAGDRPTAIGVLTSGGDAQGMNAAVRAVVRTALSKGVDVYAIYEGYEGMVEGGARIRKMEWASVGGIIYRGGTIIGTARSASFRTHEGRLRAAQNLVERGIDRLVIIGGDGSLTGANLFRQEWTSLLAELVAQDAISQEVAAQHPALSIAGLVGSIDNDMFGTDMTIGADTALHRITEAIDAISSTAASHQRTFVVEVMGRHCGYLSLMGALSGGADWVLIPESPPDVDDWEAKMCDVLRTGRLAGRRDSIVVVAEGAHDRWGNPITAEYVRQVLEERMGEDARVTILGHVQRGGAPSAFDRNMSTLLGYAAVEEVLQATPETEPLLIGLRENRITRTPLMLCVNQTHEIAELIAQGKYEQAMDMRGGSFKDAFKTFRTLVRALPHPPAPGQRRLRLLVLHAGGPAPGMNTAARAAVRIGVDKGHIMLGVQRGFRGLMSGEIAELGWMSVNGWGPVGGAELGTSRKIPRDAELPAIAEVLEEQHVDGMLIIGGMAGYHAAHKLYSAREEFPALNIPIICMPVSIDNNLPGSELSIGADTALNNIVEALDKIKQSAVAARRCFIVEVMGRNCGYLALMSGLASGAERVYLPEEGITLHDLEDDLHRMMTSFEEGKRLSLFVRNEDANPIYTTSFICSLFEAEGGRLFEARQAVLGHLQQGGNPSPFDRIQATRLSARCIDFLIAETEKQQPASSFIGLEAGRIKFHNMEEMPHMIDEENDRPSEQWWMELRPIAQLLAQGQENA